MEEKLRKKLYSICPKEREASSVASAIDNIFLARASGGKRLSIQVHSHKLFHSSCVVVPERDCSGTAESCGVFVINNGELRSKATQICKMDKAIKFSRKDNFKNMLNLLAAKISGRKKEKKDIVVTILADDVSVVDLYSAFKKHGSFSGVNEQYLKLSKKSSPIQDYNWSNKIPKESESCAFQNAIGWGVTG